MTCGTPSSGWVAGQQFFEFIKNSIRKILGHCFRDWWLMFGADHISPSIIIIYFFWLLLLLGGGGVLGWSWD